MAIRKRQREQENSGKNIRQNFRKTSPLALLFHNFHNIEKLIDLFIATNSGRILQEGIFCVEYPRLAKISSLIYIS